jgi:hypothetical protein
MAPLPESWGLQLHCQGRLWLGWLTIGIVLAAGQGAFAQLPRTSVTTFALGGAVSLNAPAPLDIYFNPALAGSRRITVEFSAARLFDLSDFDLGAGALAFRWRQVTLGAALTNLIGADYYSERSVLLAASFAPFSRLRLGAGVEQRHTAFGEGYPDASLYSLSLGVVAALRENLSLSAAVWDANRPRFCDSDPKPPLRTEIAASYSTELVSLALAHHLDSRLPDRFSVGQAFNLTGDFALLVGIESEPLELSGGFSLKLRGFNFEYGYRNNVYLGGTHRVGLRYSR